MNSHWRKQELEGHTAKLYAAILLGCLIAKSQYDNQYKNISFICKDHMTTKYYYDLPMNLAKNKEKPKNQWTNFNMTFR